MAAIFADTQRNAAAIGRRRLRLIFSKLPFVAALLIVDNEVAVLQTDLIEVLPVQPGQAQAVEPVEAGQQSARRIRLSGAAAVGGRGDAGGAEDPADADPPGSGGVAWAVRFEAIPVASGRALSPVETVT